LLEFIGRSSYTDNMIRAIRLAIRYAKWAAIGALFMLFIGLIAVVALRVVVPKLATIPQFSSWEWLEGTSENTTVITNREEIVIRDDDRLDRVVENVNNAVVLVLSRQDDASTSVERATGIVVTNDGLVATKVSSDFDVNEAVFDVMTYDGEYVEASYYAYDAYLDIVYIRVSGGNVTSMPFANADDFGAGRKVVAVESSSVEQSNRVALGVIRGYDPLFSLAPQVLASSEMHQGVFDVSFLGEVVSPGAAIISYGGELVGMNGLRNVGDQVEEYVLDANVLRESLDRVIADPNQEYVFFGASYTPITSTVARENGLEVKSGAWLAFPDRANGTVVLFGSPAQNAGLRYGDIITAVDDVPVSTENSLALLLQSKSPEDVVELTVQRGETSFSLSASLQKMPQ